MGLDRKAFIVVNPNSANASTGGQWPAMQAQIKASIGPFEWAFTERSGDATFLTREAIGRGCDLIVSVGGDGTNNEVINGFFDEKKQINPDCAFSFICRGTGGDFRKTFGWGLGLDESLRRIASGHTRMIDVGRFTYRNHDGHPAMKHFLNITSFGIGGLVDQFVNSSSKALGGRVSFMLATARALMQYKNQRVRLTVDDGPTLDMHINTVAVANGRFFGGGMMMAPDAEVDDGLFDIVVLGDLSKIDVIRQSGRIYKGTHLTMDKISHMRGERIHAESEELVLIDMDGEQPGSLPCVFEILPGVLPLCVE